MPEGFEQTQSSSPRKCKWGHGPHDLQARYCFKCGRLLEIEANPKTFAFELPLRVIQRGFKTCITCGKTHNAYAGEGNWWGSWKDPDDGHVYRHA